MFKHSPNKLLVSLIVLLLINIQSTTSFNDYDFSYTFKDSRFKRDTSVDKLTPNLDKFNQTNSDYGQFPNEPTTEDLKDKKEATDNHVYYNVTYFNNTIDSYWIDMKNSKTAIRHDMLSNAHRRAATIPLPFKFPFYGYKIENITIATGGFLFLGEAVHTWLAATQYIAPLMANFNTSIHPDSAIYYLNNNVSKEYGEFVIQWDNMYLQGVTINGSTADGKPTRDTIDKPFSFQTNLRSNGDIYFVYKQVPYDIAKINEEKHPVKVGISDAYIIDRTIFFIRRKTIYEYHKAELKGKKITNGTVLYFKALPTCNIYTDCNSCVVHSKTNSSFECSWCEASKRCSDGYDRHRQEWIKNKCDDNAVTKCPATSNDPLSKEDHPSSGNDPLINTGAVKPINPVINSNDLNANSANQQERLKSKTSNGKDQSKSKGKGGFAFLFFLMCLFVMIGYWAMYAYRNPQSRPGQFLIKYRVANWRFNNNSDQSRYATEFDSIN